MSTISLRGAAQVLLPPEDGLPYLRRPGDLRLEPGSVTVRDGVIAALDDDPAADVVIDASGGAIVPGLVDCHTHLPFAGWRAEEYEQKVTGVPYEEISRRGGGIAASARALAEASDEAVLAQARAIRAEMLAHGTTTFEAKTGYGLSREGELRLVSLARQLRPGRRHRAVRPRRPARIRRRRLDGRGRPAGDGRGRRRARHLRRVGRVPQRGPRAAGRDRAARGGPAAGARGAVQREPLRAGRARRRRALGRPPRLPAPRRPGAAGGRRVRRRAPARRRVPGRRADGARPRAGRRGRDLRARHRLQSRHVAGRLAPRGDRARGPALRLVGARGAGGVHAERRVGARHLGPDRVDRGRASRPTSWCSTRRSSTSRTGSGATRCAR